MTGSRQQPGHAEEGLREAPEVTLLDLLRELATDRSDEIALIFQGSQMTYRQLDDLSRAMASALVALGVRPGNRVAILLPAVPQAIIALFGTWAAGAIAVPIDPLTAERDLESVLHESGCSLAIVLSRFYRKVKSVQVKAAVRRIVVTNMKEYMPPRARLMFTLFEELLKGHRRADLITGDGCSRCSRSTR